ncbi:MAG: cupin domain-containing protein [Hahellaceae bacterium]|nr:cupin domain-containing protein [Hahellaceae bacterium]MCP5169815.1 cupin domain-containing protein [Hahellaceae bacterium]
MTNERETAGGPNNIFQGLPECLPEEWFETVVQAGHIRIERIVSQGHSSPASDWYDQDEHEWVMVLQGAGILLFDDGKEVALRQGDYLNIPAHVRHRVKWTDPEQVTVWLAVFYS